MPFSLETVTAVRYAWMNDVECVLENSEGLLASPFRTANRKASSNKPTTTTATNFQFSSIETPPMGFNSWNFYHCNIDENIVKAIADAIASNGMIQAGYRYVNIDDCWQVERLSNGTIQADPARFPSGMRSLADYVHSRGLRFGLYTAQGSRTCQNRPGAFLYEEIDAETYCDWGIDYLKVDACGGSNWPQGNTSWIKFRNALDACAERTGRPPIVLSVEYCRTVGGCGEWITTTANLWRTTDDIQATWSSVMSNIHTQEPMYTIARPGHFNDPDILQIGNVGLSIDQQYSHMALWCISGAPLLVGSDLIHASNTTLAILANPEVTAVDQDLGWNNAVQGHVARNSTQSEIWVKRFADGSWGVVLLNLQDDGAALDVKVQWRDLGLDKSTTAVVRDLWLQEDVGIFSGHFTAMGLRPHASSFVRVSPTKDTDATKNDRR
jgi:alpha-galactosidase